MVEEGYAAVSNRRVATKAGVTPALVQYYFPAMDELYLAVYRRAAEHSLERQAVVLSGSRPLHALWELMSDSGRTALAIEFMALANHRKIIRTEIAEYARRSYAILEQGIAEILAGTAGATAFPAGGIAILLSGAARALVMEGSLGIGNGHKEARAIVAAWLEVIEPPLPEG
jgi:AcrR family transcriptional regulator